MILQSGDKVLIAHRRLFQNDEPRFFVGEVLAYEDGVMKIDGYSYVKDMSGGMVVRKDEPRTKIVSISSDAFLIYQLPADTRLESVKFENEEGVQFLTDGHNLKMNLAEYPRSGHM